MGLFAHQPGCKCCECDCDLSLSFNSWIETAGNWTIVAPVNFEATTADDDAELTCDVPYPDWKIATVQIVQRVLGEWVRFGFRDESGDDRVYIRWKITKPASIHVHTLEIIEIDDGGSPTTLATITWNGTSSTTELTRNFHIWHDPDNFLFEVFYGNTSTTMIGPVRVSTQTTLDRPYVATETITDVVDFEKSTIGVARTPTLFRKCLRRDTGTVAHVDRASSEFEVTISGVTAGNGTSGGEYGLFNDTFVLPFSPASIDSDAHYLLIISHPVYGAVRFLLAIGYRYDVSGVTPLRILLRIWIQVAHEVGWDVVKQVTDFKCWMNGECSFDWRSLGGGDAYYSTNDCDQLSFDSTDNSYGANFSAATITVVPVP